MRGQPQAHGRPAQARCGLSAASACEEGRELGEGSGSDATLPSGIADDHCDSARRCTAQQRLRPRPALCRTSPAKAPPVVLQQHCSHTNSPGWGRGFSKEWRATVALLPIRNELAAAKAGLRTGSGGGRKISNDNVDSHNGALCIGGIASSILLPSSWHQPCAAPPCQLLQMPQRTADATHTAAIFLSARRGADWAQARDCGNFEDLAVPCDGTAEGKGQAAAELPVVQKGEQWLAGTSAGSLGSCS